MHVVEILLPLTPDNGPPRADREFNRLRQILTERFGGFTAFLRSPAEGVWRNPEVGGVDRDDITVVEVMTDVVDPDWWAKLRNDLELRLGQKEIVIRSHEAKRL